MVLPSPAEFVKAERLDGGSPCYIGAVMGLAAVLLSWSLPGCAGLCAASWGYSRQPTRLLVSAGTVAVAIIYGAVHTLGWLGWLTPAHLFGLVFGLCCAPITVSLGTRWGRRRLRRARGSLWSVIGRVGQLFIRPSSLAGLGLLTVWGLTVYTAFLSYLAPSSGWDGLMYHEPMVGFALQNQGFSPVELGRADRFLTVVDGYPRLVENLMLYLVAAWDRRVIELVPSLLYPLTLVACYALLRGFMSNRKAALGLAVGYVLMPALALQLRSTYVDLGFATFLAAALCFLSRRRLDAHDLWMASLAIGMVGASKISGFIVAPLIGFGGVILTVAAARRTRRWGLLGHLLGGFLLVVALAGPTYWRNWSAHENPLWPGKVEVAALGIDWDGPLDIADMSVSAERTLEMLVSPPEAGVQHHDTRDNGYGNAPPLLVLPLAAVGLCLGLLAVFRGPNRGPPARLLLFSLPLLATAAISPALHWARLNLHIALAVFMLAAWALRRIRSPAVSEGVIGALIIGSIATLYGSEPAWDVDPSRRNRLVAMSPGERAVQRDTIFTLMPTETARAREADLGTGDLLVFAHVPWTGLLWNERMDNRVVFLEPPRAGGAQAWVEEAIRRDARWAVVRGRSSISRALRAHTGWEEVGNVVQNGESVAFRRLQPRPPDAPPAP